MSEKKYPERIRFLIGDDIRSDGPKPMIIGFTADDVVRVELRKEQLDPSKSAPVVLQGLAILAAFINCKGPFQTESSLYLPDGTAIYEHQKLEGGIDSDPKTGKDSINFIAKFSPIAIPLFGEYTFVIKLDDRDYVYKFKVARAGPLK